MKRIIFVPQYPSEMRYQEWWLHTFEKKFVSAGYTVITLGAEWIHEKTSNDEGMFAPINAAIEFETQQIKEYMELEIKPDDILFLADLSFPDIFCNVLFHKQCSKMFAFCHATSLNKFDYFEKVVKAKFPVETAHSEMFDKVFVGSKYHQSKLYGWDNTVVTYLPFPPISSSQIREKSYDIMSASRPTKQKVDIELEVEVTRQFGQINRPMANTWEEYYDNLARSKCLLITAHEDTFGYQIVDAILNNCIPIARKGLAYPELLDKKYLYNNKEELLLRVYQAINNKITVPELKCKKQMKEFYTNIISEMEEEND